MVRLKENEIALGIVDDISFNSKMVRLKVSEAFYRIPIRLFQFQNGAVKRIGGITQVDSPKHVSIPKWCG